MEAGKALECCKGNLMDDSGESSEDQNAQRIVNSKDGAHKVSEEDSIGNGIRGYSCYVLAKKLSTFSKS